MLKLGLFEKFLIFLGYIAELFIIFSKRLIDFKGIKIGYEEGEFGVKVGQLITLYGKLVYEKDTYKLYIDRPLYIVKNHKEFL